MAGNIHIVKTYSRRMTRAACAIWFSTGDNRKRFQHRKILFADKGKSFCTERGISAIQKTLHYYKSHNLNDYATLEPPELQDLLLKFSAPLRTFYNRISGNDADFTGEKLLHPQLIHYPSGGGFSRVIRMDLSRSESG
jgi:hypothetical protein